MLSCATECAGTHVWPSVCRNVDHIPGMRGADAQRAQGDTFAMMASQTARAKALG